MHTVSFTTLTKTHETAAASSSILLLQPTRTYCCFIQPTRTFCFFCFLLFVLHDLQVLLVHPTKILLLLTSTSSPTHENQVLVLIQPTKLGLSYCSSSKYNFLKFILSCSSFIVF